MQLRKDWEWTVQAWREGGDQVSPKSATTRRSERETPAEIWL